jgi:hypothetical protein
VCGEDEVFERSDGLKECGAPVFGDDDGATRQLAVAARGITEVSASRRPGAIS